jgi:hypothetical protein
MGPTASTKSSHALSEASDKFLTAMTRCAAFGSALLLHRIEPGKI